MTGYRIAALWAGITLSIRNLCGVVIGATYGWPKNILHWKGIQESILDLCATIPVHFVIADGIVAMEGNGPLNGTARSLGKIVIADDPVAADATCARLMGFEPGTRLKELVSILPCQCTQWFCQGSLPLQAPSRAQPIPKQY